MFAKMVSNPQFILYSPINLLTLGDIFSLIVKDYLVETFEISCLSSIDKLQKYFQ